MGISGRIAKLFLHSQMTPLLALVAVLLGLFAVMVTPREEEPQINVTMANVLIAYPGASAQDVAQTVATPAEQVLSQIAGVDHVYSVAQPGMAVITVQFKVGEEHVPSLVKLYDVVHSNSDWLPPTLGVATPIIKAKGIDDVPVVALTLWRDQAVGGGLALTQVAHAIEAELKRVPGTREVNTVGGTQRVVKVLLNPESLNAFQLSMQDVRAALQSADVARNAGNLVQDNREVLVQTGSFLSDANEVKQLVVGISGGKPVFLRDIAEVQDGADQPGSYVWFGTGPAAQDKDIKAQGEFTAVTVAITKKPGANAVDIADHLLSRVEELKGSVIPDDVHVSVTRNYGETANDKAMKLIKKLIFATLAVVALVWIAMGLPGDARGPKPELNPFVLKELQDGVADLLVLALDQGIAHFYNGNPATEAPEHLSELQPDVAAPHDNQVFRYCFQLQNRLVRQIGYPFKSFGDKRPPAHVDENLFGGHFYLADSYLLWPDKSGFPIEIGDVLVLVQSPRNPIDRLFDQAVFAGFYLFHIGVGPLGNHHP